MTVHYHGLPLTPEVMLYDLAGENVCISYATKRDAQTDICLRLMQSIMFDNGAFTIHQQGGELDEVVYYDWLEAMLGHPHWAVVPDVIDGTVEQQRALVATWPFPREFGAPVFHIGLPNDYLLELVDEWPRVCLGSSGVYWQIGSPAWKQRMLEIRDLLAAKRRQAPWLHGLRMMAQAGNGLGLASVDSVNTARNYKDYEDMPRHVARRQNRMNSSTIITPSKQEVDMFA